LSCCLPPTAALSALGPTPFHARHVSSWCHSCEALGGRAQPHPLLGAHAVLVSCAPHLAGPL
jgi:hypothetical protein